MNVQITISFVEKPQQTLIISQINGPCYTAQNKTDGKTFSMLGAHLINIESYCLDGENCLRHGEKKTFSFSVKYLDESVNKARKKLLRRQ